MKIKGLKDLFNFVCIQNKGKIEISCSGSSGGLYWNTLYTIGDNSLFYEAGYDEINQLCDSTWSELSDYPENRTEWEISCNEAKIETFGQSLEQDEDEDDDDFYDRNMNTYNLTINEFNEIYKIL
jgi:hypothetical protein